MPSLPAPDVASSLPSPISSLVGREREVAAIAGLLRQPTVRLVTMTGPGGVGKTRLALAAVGEIGDAFPDGIWFVSLSSVSDPDLVTVTVTHTLGVRDAGEESLLERLTAFLKDKRLLLVLDNFEQVVGAAPLVADLLVACPELTVFVTSRVRLRVSGEREYEVPPLALPDQTGVLAVPDTMRFEAVRLFVERGQAARASFDLTEENAQAVVDICRRLDGLPLAIELAAARVKVLPPGALLARLEKRLPLLTGGALDAPTRQRTMSDAIAWSYDLLSAPEQALFRRLAVFVGGFTLEAAEAVSREVEASGSRDANHAPSPSTSRPPDASTSVLEGLASLVDKSLVRCEDGPGVEPRYRMLETVREFGLERLAEHGEADECRRQHAVFFLAVAEAAESRQWSDHPTWRALVEREYDNLRAAAAWFEQDGSAEESLRLGYALMLFWNFHGSASEGRGWLARSLAMNPAIRTPARAKVLYAAGLLARRQGDLAQAGELGRAALALAQEIGDAWSVAATHVLLGHVALGEGDPARARSSFEEALAGFRRIDDAPWAAAALTGLGVEAVVTGDYDRAAPVLEEAVGRWREIGNAWGTAWSLFNFARVAKARGDFARAARLYQESLVLRAEDRDVAGIADSLVGLANVMAGGGWPERAARLLGAADAQYRRHALAFTVEVDGSFKEARAAIRARLDEPAFTLAWREGQEAALADIIAEAATAAVEFDGATFMGRGNGAQSPLGLSPREVEVLRLLVIGSSDREIADQLFISPRTASKHVAAVLAKLEVSSRAAAAARAVRDGLI
ncbi:MAG: tetratricopeptide repeat protein [Chloroflexota bacterium]|nr:tetratricopeptide repeat protein [Chloroflexota bacterium]